MEWCRYLVKVLGFSKFLPANTLVQSVVGYRITGSQDPITHLSPRIDVFTRWSAHKEGVFVHGP